MTIDELWQKIQSEISGLKGEVSGLEDKVSGLEGEILDIKKEQKAQGIRIDKLEEKMDYKFEIVNNNIARILEYQTEMKEEMDYKFEIANNNIARILEHQTEMKQEINDKLDQFMLKNNLEHKQFAYQIAELEMKTGITRIS